MLRLTKLEFFYKINIVSMSLFSWRNSVIDKEVDGISSLKDFCTNQIDDFDNRQE